MKMIISGKKRSALPFLGGYGGFGGYGLGYGLGGIGYTSVHQSHHFIPHFGFGYGR